MTMPSRVAQQAALMDSAPLGVASRDLRSSISEDVGAVGLTNTRYGPLMSSALAHKASSLVALT